MTQKITFPQRVLDVLEWPQVLAKLADMCGSDPGRAYTETLSPLSRDEAAAQLKLVSCIKELVLRQEGPDFSGLTDISGYITRTEKEGVLTLAELGHIRTFTVFCARIRSWLRENKEEFPALGGPYRSFEDLKALQELLSSSITENNELNTGRYPELRRMSNEIASIKAKIEKKINTILGDPNLASVLQERVYSMRNDRYVVLIKANMKGRIRGAIHDVSSSGATIYVEPDSVAELNNQMIMLERELELEVSLILRELSQNIASNALPLRTNLAAGSYCDFLRAAARFSMALKGNEQQIIDEPVIELHRARHPLLQLMSPETTVANDFELGSTFRALIISGANTGGKTVLLKTIGLCALMNIHGLHLPAGPDSRMGYFTGLLADIGDDQNLSQSLSTFSGQITIISEMIQKAHDRSIVMIDEIVVGTNPRQGAALAQAILERLIEQGSLLIVTTHYTELKDLAAQDPRFQNASVSFDMETLRPTYRLKTGMPGVSYAAEIARNYGLDDIIIARSRELMDSRELSFEALNEQMRQHQEELEEEQEKLKARGKEIASREQELKTKEEQLARDTANLKHVQGIDFIEELKKYREEIARHISSLQNKDIKAAGELQHEIISLQEQMQQQIDSDTRQRFTRYYEPLSAEDLHPGDRVFIVSLEQEGIVETVHSNRRATVLMGGSIRTEAVLADLMRPRHGAPQPPAKKKPADKKRPAVTVSEQPTAPLTIQTRYNTVDLRGKRVEEALRAMGADLDYMSRHGIEAAVVIHGHGTGALKEAVRSELRMSPYVTSFRPGEMGEGGDGVTIVMLRV